MEKDNMDENRRGVNRTCHGDMQYERRTTHNDWSRSNRFLHSFETETKTRGSGPVRNAVVPDSTARRHRLINVSHTAELPESQCL